jgi:hypothetical protein
MYTSDSLPALLDFYVYQADTMKRTIRIVNKTTGDPVDLTGAAIKIQVRTPDYQSVALTIQTGAGITVSGNAILVSFDIAINEGEYIYDLQSIKDGVTTTYLKGAFFVTKNITV